MRRTPGLTLLALATLAFHLATNGRYGYFRDELYFIACGHHLAWGYVDQPPLIALVAGLSDRLSGGSLVLFRLPAALAHAGLVFATGRLAGRLGAGPFGRGLAAVAVLASPTLLVSGHLLTMNAFEPLLWLAAATIVVAQIDEPRPHLWLLFGAVLGVGLLDKHSMAFFALALLVGVAATRQRAILRTRWFPLGLALAAAIVLPHLAWQAGHGFPMLELLRNGRLYKNAPFSASGFALGQLLEEHPLNAPIWLAGLWFLWRGRHRALGLAHLVLFGLLILLEAKTYYLAPAYPILFAAGGVQLERALRWPRLRWAAPALLAVGGAATAPLVVPVLSPARLVAYQEALGVHPPEMERQRYSALPQHLADELPWQGLAATVGRVYQSLPPEERAHAVVFAQNYGQAGALDHFGAAYGLPPASSGHNSYYLWGPHGDGDVAAVIIVVAGGESGNRRVCTRLDEAARTPADPYALPSESELPIYLCRGLHPPVRELWPALKKYI